MPTTPGSSINQKESIYQTSQGKTKQTLEQWQTQKLTTHHLHPLVLPLLIAIPIIVISLALYFLNQ